MTNPRLIWMLYDRADLQLNHGFVQLMANAAQPYGYTVKPVLTEELHLGFSETGQPYCGQIGSEELPAAVFSRQRNAQISSFLEQCGIKVLNGSRVCDICNHKGNTHLFLKGLPMAETVVLRPGMPPLCPFPWPVIVKPARGHGGKNVCPVSDQTAFEEAITRVFPDDAIVQPILSGAGRDLRIYVLHNEILTGVMRSAREGIISNFKLGGRVREHVPTREERELCERVITRFTAAGAPMYLCGVDFLYRDGCPVISEVEDVVGCRMLYETTNIDICALYFQRFQIIGDKSEFI